MIASKDHLPEATSKNELKVTVTISTDPTVHPKDVPVKGGCIGSCFIMLLLYSTRVSSKTYCSGENAAAPFLYLVKALRLLIL